MILARGVLYEDSRLSAVLEGLEAACLEAVAGPPLEAETVISACGRLAEQGEQGAHGVLAQLLRQCVRHRQHPAVGLLVAGQPLRQQPQLYQPPVLTGPLAADGPFLLQDAENGVHLGFQNARPGAQVAGGQELPLPLRPGQQAADHRLVKGQPRLPVHQPLIVDDAGQLQPGAQQLLANHSSPPR